MRPQRGYTLVELVVVILIVGILAVVSVPLYLGYTKEAKLAEGKAMAGSVMTALQGCTQAKGPAGAAR
jgi:prepilin-type N-terminal cleavage/methylation domain-containing protein